MKDSHVIWTPPSELVGSCALSRFIHSLRQRFGVACESYEDLHTWSIQNPETFWSHAVEFLDIVGMGALDPLYERHSGPTPLARSWFPKFSLNFAENLLQGPGEQVAIISWSEDRLKRNLSLGELRIRVSQVAQHLSSVGVKAGDRVFAYLPNVPEAVICMLAAASLGATWSSCGTDYQVEGLLARIDRVKPSVLIAATSYIWRGKEEDVLGVLQRAVTESTSIEHVVLVNYLSQPKENSLRLRDGVTSSSFHDIVMATPPSALKLPRFNFSHPLYIMFSSGTTGQPKGIVHGAGGTLLEHKKELILHSDVRPADRLFYQTSTSWMMWNWLVSGLACQATIVLYDGDPMIHDGRILWELADSEQVSHFGTSAAYIGELQRRALRPRELFTLKSLRAIFSTGSALYPDKFDFVMEAIKPLWLQSISGGTDIIGCFGLGCPMKPVIRGEVQCKSLGYDVRVFSSDGITVVGEQGELVCASPAPSMPVYFLEDTDGSAYRDAYFRDFDGIWRHGDFVEETTDGGLIFGGRSDATLKPSGVRVATADIYAALSRVPEVQGALAVGYTPIGSPSEKIILFVVLPHGSILSDELRERIRSELKRVNAYYVPALTLQAPELPRTTNNKLAELSVKRILRGEDPGNQSALANPASLDFFKNSALADVRERLG